MENNRGPEDTVINDDTLEDYLDDGGTDGYYDDWGTGDE